MPEENPAPSTEPTAPSGGEGAPGGTAPAPSETPAPTPEKTFTQAQLDQLAGRRAAEAERAATNKIKDQLGGLTPAEAKKVLDAHKAAEDAKKDELTRAQEALAQAQSDAEAARAEAATARFTSRLRGQLAEAGVPAKALDRALRMVDLAPDAADADVAAEIEALKETVPGLFAPPAGEPQRPPAPSGVTGGATPPAGGQPGRPPGEAGRERARAALASRNTTNDRFARLRS